MEKGVVIPIYKITNPDKELINPRACMILYTATIDIVKGKICSNIKKFNSFFCP
jgi:hypothetical protein